MHKEKKWLQKSREFSAALFGLFFHLNSKIQHFFTNPCDSRKLVWIRVIMEHCYYHPFYYVVTILIFNQGYMTFEV